MNTITKILVLRKEFIRIKDTGVIGAITLSGMAEAEDHQFVVSAIEDFLKEQA